MTTKGVGIEVSGFTLTALGQRQADAASELRLAVSFYLSERDADRPGWAYPGFLPAEPAATEPVVSVDLEPDLWRELALEAERQGVPIERLAAHAAIYFAAELDAGRITKRIVDDFDADPS